MQPRLKALLICDKVPHQVCDESYKQHDESDGEVACVEMHSNLKWKRLVHALIRVFVFLCCINITGKSFDTAFYQDSAASH